MSTVTRIENAINKPGNEPVRFVAIHVTDKQITAELSDGRVVSVPLWWSWRLEQATLVERQRYELLGAGTTAYWPAVRQ